MEIFELAMLFGVYIVIGMKDNRMLSIWQLPRLEKYNVKHKY